MMLSSYPSIYALGHRAVKEIFANPVVVQEKIDGSQISFGVFKGELYVRSKSAQIHVAAPDSVFSKGVAEIVKRQHDLMDGWIYRGEYLSKPKHNVLPYDRVPKDHIILFDVERGDQDFLCYDELASEAQRLGFEIVPNLFGGTWDVQAGVEAFKGLLETVSILGGPKIEGVVIKNYFRFSEDKKALMGKYVSEAFKESHASLWKNQHPGKGDVLALIQAAYRSPARWQKAVQHLRDAGHIEDSPKDIGMLIQEIPADILQECGDEIREALFKHFWPQIRRGLTAGVADWYKEQLLKQQFEVSSLSGSTPDSPSGEAGASEAPIVPVEVPVEGQDGSCSG